MLESFRLPMRENFDDDFSPTVSLDQLYSQAVVLQPMLALQMQRLARSSSALLPVATELDPVEVDAQDAGAGRGKSLFWKAGDVLWRLMVGMPRGTRKPGRAGMDQATQEGWILCKWSQIVQDRAQLSRLALPNLKHLDERALHKLLFLYHGDASRLCDIVRQRLVFESLADLSKCLNAIANDKVLQVVDVKNRFAPDADVRSTAGYRDVLLKVRICTKGTRMLGVSGHVCELQLAHREMLACLSPLQHRRFLAYGDAMVLRSQKSLVLAAASMLGCCCCFGAHMHTMRRWWHNRAGQVRTGGMVDDLEHQQREVRVSNPDRTLWELSDKDSLALLEQEGVLLHTSLPVGDEQLRSDLRKAIFQTIRMRCMFPGGFLSKKLQTAARIAVRRSDVSMVLVRAPSFVVHKKTMFVILLAAVLGCFLNMNIFGLDQDVASNSEFRARHVRVTVLDTRATAAAPQGASGDLTVSIKSFALVRNGCTSAVQNGYEYVDKQVLYLSFPHEVRANGWALTTSTVANSEAQDPVRFHVHATTGPSDAAVAGITPADCLVKRNRASANDVKKMSEKQAREQVEQQLSMMGSGWCKDIECAVLSDADLVKLCLPPSAVPEEDWHVVSASGWYWSIQSLRSIPDPGWQLDSIASNRDRGHTHLADLQPPWWHTLALFFRKICIVFFIAASICFAKLGWTLGAQGALAMVFFSSGVIFLIAAVSCVVNQRSSESLHWWVSGFVEVGVGMVFMYREDMWALVIPVYFVVSSISYNIQTSLMTHGDNTFGLDFLACLTMAIWMSVFCNYLWVKRQTSNDMKQDVAVYDRVWEELQTPEAQVALARLEVAVSKCLEASAVDTRMHPEQLLLTQAEIELVGITQLRYTAGNYRKSGREIAGPGVSTPKASLSIGCHDLLYAQAMILNPIFQFKVQVVARASSGVFLASDDPITTSANGMSPGSISLQIEEPSSREVESVSFVTADQWPRQGSLKRVDRMVEKCLRVYKGKIAMLCDIVRQCIVFEAVDDLCRAIEVLNDDEEVEVVRIKNRLATNYDSQQSFSYRDVLVNLRINSPLTRELGVFKHVCELQLVLKAYMLQKTQEGHKRYVDFRNKCCK